MDLTSIGDFIAKVGFPTFMAVALLFIVWWILVPMGRNLARLTTLMAVHLKVEEQADEDDPRVSGILQGVITRKEKRKP